MKQKGFTLVELLIVVAVLGILASIAVPNYRDATIKSRVTKVKMDLRTIGGALQTYRLDRNIYPRMQSDLQFFADYLLPGLTSPVAYLNQVSVRDPFGPIGEYEDPPPPGREPVFEDASKANEPVLKNSYTYTPYYNFTQMHGKLKGLRKEAFALASMGPDRMDTYIVDIPFSPGFYRYPTDSPRDSIYNPSNGIVSPGDIGYFGGDISIGGLVGG